MHVLFYNVWMSFQFCTPPKINLRQAYLFQVKKCLLHLAKSPTDLFFLMTLKDVFIKLGHFTFDWQAQQYVVEFSEIVVEESAGLSIVTSLT